MNTDYLATLSETKKATTRTKSAVDASMASDFYSALGDAVPQWRALKRNTNSVIAALSKEAASLADGELPEDIARELSMVSNERNRQQGRHGQAADFSGVKLRGSERLRLRSEVSPALLGRANALAAGALEMFTPKRLDASKAYGMHLQNLIPLRHLSARDERSFSEQRYQFDESMGLNRKAQKDRDDNAKRALDQRASAEHDRRRRQAEIDAFEKRLLEDMDKDTIGDITDEMNDYYDDNPSAGDAPEDVGPDNPDDYDDGFEVGGDGDDYYVPEEGEAGGSGVDDYEGD